MEYNIMSGRAVDQQGAVIDVLVQPKRDRFAAVRFFRKLLRSSRRRESSQTSSVDTEPRRKSFLPHVAHRQSRYLNNRAENSHQSIRPGAPDESLQAACASPGSSSLPRCDNAFHVMVFHQTVEALH